MMSEHLTMAVKARTTLHTLGFERDDSILDEIETYKFFPEYVRDLHSEFYFVIETSPCIDITVELTRYFRLDFRYEDFHKNEPVCNIAYYMRTFYGIMENRVKDIRRNP